MPTIKQKKAIEKIVEKRGSVSAAMIEAGYSENTAKNPSNLTKSKAWEEYMEQFLSDADLAKKHQELLDQKRFSYFVFPKNMKDEEIIERVNDIGIEVVNIRDGEKGRYAFYTEIDAVARKSALDMAYKLKGTYAPEKKLVGNFNLNDEHREKARNAIKNIAGCGDTG